MAAKMGFFLPRLLTAQEKALQVKMIAEKYNWEKTSAETFKVYQKVMGMKD